MKTHSVRTASSQALTSDFKSFVFLTDSSESQGTHIPHLLCVLSVRSPRIFSAFLIMKVTFTNPHKNKIKTELSRIQGTKKAGDGNRTHVSSLEGWCSTIELHPHHL